jgi:hypothetical protein
MMKKIGFYLIFAFCFPIVHAGYADGLISAGEYEWFAEWFNGTLVVNGGGGNVIEVRNSALIEVQSTSTPLGLGVGGIMDLVLKNYSHLDYYNGATQELAIRNYATADLYGGRIDYITSYQYATTTYINLFCQSGWSWIFDGQDKVGITGLWNNGLLFTIDFIDKTSLGFSPVWENINVITPEPTTMLLLGLGGLLIRRKK